MREVIDFYEGEEFSYKFEFNKREGFSLVVTYDDADGFLGDIESAIVDGEVIKCPHISMEKNALTELFSRQVGLNWLYIASFTYTQVQNLKSARSCMDNLTLIITIIDPVILYLLIAYGVSWVFRKIITQSMIDEKIAIISSRILFASFTLFILYYSYIDLVNLNIV